MLWYLRKRVVKEQIKKKGCGAKSSATKKKAQKVQAVFQDGEDDFHMTLEPEGDNFTDVEETDDHSLADSRSSEVQFSYHRSAVNNNATVNHSPVDPSGELANQVNLMNTDEIQPTYSTPSYKQTYSHRREPK